MLQSARVQTEPRDRGDDYEYDHPQPRTQRFGEHLQRRARLQDEKRHGSKAEGVGQYSP